MFLVRERDSKRYLGIFTAPDTASLWDMVDAHDDPCDYEWAEIFRGGFIFRHPRPLLNDMVGEDDEFNDEWDGPFPDAKLNTDEWMDSELYFGDLKWVRFDFADVGDGVFARIIETLEERDALAGSANNDNGRSG